MSLSHWPLLPSFPPAGWAVLPPQRFALPGRCWASMERTTPLGSVTVCTRAAHARIVPTDSILAFSNFRYLNFIIKMGFFSL